MIKLPVPKNEIERLNALNNYEILNSLREHDFDRITELASLICEVPISLVSLIDEKRQWFKSSIGLDISETSRDLAFCQYTIMDTVFFEVENAAKDDRFKENSLVTSEPHIRFYAGFPLIDPQGYALGTLCVIDRKPRILSPSQKRALELLAQEVISLIVERRLKQEMQNFEKVFNFSNDLIFVGGKDGFFKKINPAFKKVLGWDEDYLLKTSTFEFIHPDDIANTFKELEKLSQGLNTVNFRQRFKASDNQYKTIQWTSSPELTTGNIFGIGRDVSSLELRERELAISEEKLRAFFENSQGLMCTHDVDGNFITVNAAGASIIGYSLKEITSMSLFDIVPEAGHKLLRGYLQDIAINGSAKGQMVTQDKDGSIRIWMYNNVLQRSTDNELYIIGNAVDITERHQLEKDLEHTKQLLEQTNKVARVGGWEFDVKRQKISWTAVTKEIHSVAPDFKPDLALGINFYKAGPSREKITEVFNRGLEHGTSWSEELQLIDAKGQEIWVRAIGNAEFENGKCKRLFGTFQDINDYKLAELALKQAVITQEKLNSELKNNILLIEQQDKKIQDIQQYKFLADSIPEIIWTSNPDGSVDYYNQYWFDYTGMTLEETKKNGWKSILHPDDAKKDFLDRSLSFATGKPYQSEVRIRRASDGLYKWHLARALALKNDEGNIIKWFGSCTDIDEYKRALDLEGKISQYEDFNRIIAHNLRGPAGSISMILDMIDDAADETEKKEFMQMLHQSNSALNETLGELMKVLEVRNNYNVPYDDCNFQDIILGIERMLSGQIASAKATITTDFEVTSMLFPKMYLESIFYNMISNSLKYRKQDISPQIKITSALKDGSVTLTFADNGLGIDLNKHGKNMFKLNSVFHPGHDSKGIGLFMTKTQIETFGGHINVESEPNVGTKFTITF